MTRAERRARMERTKKRVARYQRIEGNVTPETVGRLAQTRQPCSCIYCRWWSRKWAGPTRHERMAMEDL